MAKGESWRKRSGTLGKTENRGKRKRSKEKPLKTPDVGKFVGWAPAGGGECAGLPDATVEYKCDRMQMNVNTGGMYELN